MQEIRKIYSTIIEDDFPPTITILFGEQKLVYAKRKWNIGDQLKGLRYGENPDQPAALYQLESGEPSSGGIIWRKPLDALVSALTESQMLQAGKHPGKTNLTDVDNGINILQYLSAKPACVILKHNNPCGAAWFAPDAGGLTTAFEKAFLSDRIAAFGGAIVCNAPLDHDTAVLISENYFEVIAAPAYEAGTLDLLKTRKNLRILEIPGLADLSRLRQSAWLDIKSLADGGLIVQKSFQNKIASPEDFLPACAASGNIEVCARRPTKSELEDLFFAWAVEAGVSSNSVIFASRGATISIGSGQQDRVGCVELAIQKAYAKYADKLAYEKYQLSLYELRKNTKSSAEWAEKLADVENITRNAKAGLDKSCLVSDGFFPFRDGVDLAIEQGVAAIAQPGGAMRDAEVIIACNEATPQVGMVFTGQRSFKH